MRDFFGNNKVAILSAVLALGAAAIALKMFTLESEVSE